MSIRKDFLSGYINFPNDPTLGAGKDIEFQDHSSVFRMGEYGQGLMVLAPTAYTAYKFGNKFQSKIRKRYYQELRSLYAPTIDFLSSISNNQTTLDDRLRATIRQNTTDGVYDLTKIMTDYPFANQAEIETAARLIGYSPGGTIGAGSSSIMTGSNINTGKHYFGFEMDSGLDELRPNTQAVIVQTTESTIRDRTITSELKGSAKRMVDIVTEMLQDQNALSEGVVVTKDRLNPTIMNLKFKDKSGLEHKLQLPFINKEVHSVSGNAAADIMAVETAHSTINRVNANIPLIQNRKGQKLAMGWSIELAHLNDMPTRQVILRDPMQTAESQLKKELKKLKILSNGSINPSAIKKISNSVTFENSPFMSYIDNPSERGLSKQKNRVYLYKLAQQEAIITERGKTDLNFNATRELRKLQDQLTEDIYSIKNTPTVVYESNGKLVELRVNDIDALGNSIERPQKLINIQMASASSATNYNAFFSNKHIPTIGGHRATPDIFARQNTLPGFTPYYESQGYNKYTQSINETRYNLEDRISVKSARKDLILGNRKVGGIIIRPAATTPFQMTMIDEKYLNITANEQGYFINKAIESSGSAGNVSYKDLINVYTEDMVFSSLALDRPERSHTITLTDNENIIINKFQKDTVRSASSKDIRSIRNKILAKYKKSNYLELTIKEAKLLNIKITPEMRKSKNIGIFFSFDKPSNINRRTGSVKINLITPENSHSMFTGTPKMIEKSTLQQTSRTQMNIMIDKSTKMPLAKGDYTSSMVGNIVAKFAVKQGTDIITNSELLSKGAMGFKEHFQLGSFTQLVTNILNDPLITKEVPELMLKKHPTLKGYSAISSGKLLALINNVFETFIMGSNKKMFKNDFTISPETLTPKYNRLNLDGTPVDRKLQIRKERGLVKQVLYPENPNAPIKIITNTGYELTLDDVANRNSVHESRKLQKTISGYLKDFESELENIVKKSTKFNPILSETPVHIEYQNLLKLSKTFNSQGNRYQPLYVIDRAKDGKATIVSATSIRSTGIPIGGNQKMSTGRGGISSVGLRGAPSLGPDMLLSLEEINPSFAGIMESNLLEKFRYYESSKFVAAELNQDILRGTSMNKRVPEGKAAQAFKELLENTSNAAIYQETVDGITKTTFKDMMDEAFDAVQVYANGEFKTLSKEMEIMRQSGAHINSVLDIGSKRINNVANAINELVSARLSEFHFDNDMLEALINPSPTISINNHNVLALDLGIQHQVETTSSLGNGLPRFTKEIYLSPINAYEDTIESSALLELEKRMQDKSFKLKGTLRQGNKYVNDILRLLSIVRMNNQIKGADRTGITIEEILSKAHNGSALDTNSLLASVMSSAVAKPADDLRNILAASTNGKAALGRAVKGRSPFSAYVQISASTFFKNANGSVDSTKVYMSPIAFNKMMNGSLPKISESLTGIEEKIANFKVEANENDFYKKIKNDTKVRVPFSEKSISRQIVTLSGLSQKDNQIKYRKTQTISERIFNSMKTDLSRIGLSEKDNPKVTVKVKEIEMIVSAVKNNKFSKVSKENKLIINYLNELQQYTKTLIEKKPNISGNTKTLLNAYELAREHLVDFNMYRLTKGASYQDSLNYMIKSTKRLETLRSLVVGLGDKKQLVLWGSKKKSDMKVLDQFVSDQLRSKFGDIYLKNSYGPKESLDGATERVVKSIKNRFVPIMDKKHTSLAMIDQLANLVGETNGAIKTGQRIPRVHELQRIANLATKIQDIDVFKNTPMAKEMKQFTTDLAPNIRAILSGMGDVEKIRNIKLLALNGGIGGLIHAQPALRVAHGGEYSVQIITRKLIEESMKDKEGSFDSKEVNAIFKQYKAASNRLFADVNSIFRHDRDFDGDAVGLYLNIIDEKHGRYDRSKIIADDLFALMYDRSFIREGNSVNVLNLASNEFMDIHVNSGPLKVQSMEYQSFDNFVDKNKERIMRSLELDGKIPKGQMTNEFKKVVGNLRQNVLNLRKRSSTYNKMGEDEFLKKYLTYSSQTYASDPGSGIKIGIVGEGYVEKLSQKAASKKYDIGEGYNHLFPEMYKDSASGHSTRLFNIAKEAQQKVDDVATSYMAKTKSGQEFYTSMLNELLDGPAETRSFYVQKTSTQWLYKFSLFSRYYAHGLREGIRNGYKKGSNNLAEAIGFMGERFAAIMEQQPGIQAKKGVPTIEPFIKNMFSYFAKSKDNLFDFGRVSSDTKRQTRFEQFKTKILSGHIEAQLHNADRAILERTGFINMSGQSVTVNQISAYHEMKTTIAESMLEKVSKDQVLSLNLVQGKLSETGTILDKGRKNELVDKLYRKHWKVLAKDLGIGRNSVDKEITFKLHIDNFINRVEREVIDVDVGKIDTGRVIGTKMSTDHGVAALKAVAHNSAYKSFQSKDFLRKLMNFTTQDMDAIVGVMNEAQKTGVASDMNKMYNLITRVNPNTFTMESFGTEMASLYERELATGNKTNPMFNFIKKFIPAETLETVVSFAQQNRAKRLFYNSSSKARPNFMIGPKLLPKAIIGLGAMVGIGMFAPNPQVGKNTNAVAHKRSEYDIEMPKNILRKYNNRAMVSHIPKWVGVKLDNINRKRQQYTYMTGNFINAAL